MSLISLHSIASLTPALSRSPSHTGLLGPLLPSSFYPCHSLLKEHVPAMVLAPQGGLNWPPLPLSFAAGTLCSRCYNLAPYGLPFPQPSGPSLVLALHQVWHPLSALC